MTNLNIYAFRTEALDWCRGKNWYVRVPFLIWLAYVLVRHLSNPMYSSILGALNLGLHEFGHFIFSPFGEFLHILGGTLFQVFAPIFGIFNFYQQEDFFAIALSFGWLSTSLFDMARYVSDARTMNLPLVSPFGGGDDAIHDWNFLLSRLGLLQFDTKLAFLIKCIATLSMLICLALGAWLIWQMYKTKATLNQL